MSQTLDIGMRRDTIRSLIVGELRAGHFRDLDALLKAEAALTEELTHAVTAERQKREIEIQGAEGGTASRPSDEGETGSPMVDGNDVDGARSSAVSICGTEAVDATH